MKEAHIAGFYAITRSAVVCVEVEIDLRVASTSRTLTQATSGPMTSIITHCTIGVSNCAGHRTTTRLNYFLGVFSGLKVSIWVYWERFMNKLKRNWNGDDDNGLETLALETGACALHSLHTSAHQVLERRYRNLLSISIFLLQRILYFVEYNVLAHPKIFSRIPLIV